MSSIQRKSGIHSLIRAAIALGFAAFIAWLVKGDHINLYIAPRMVLLVKLSSIALYAIGIFNIYLAYRHFSAKSVSCGCDDIPTGSIWKHGAIYGLFALPLLLGILLPNTTMGSALAAKKGMNLNASSSGRIGAPIAERPAPGASQVSSPAQSDSEAQSNVPAADNSADQSAVAASGELSDEELDNMFVADDYNEDFARLAKQLYRQDVIEVKEELFMEILTAVDLFLSEFQGKTVEIEGFVYREPDMNERQFVVGRFAMDCCSADALPYGILVEYDKAGRYANDTWVKLRATIGKTEYQEQEIMSLHPEMIQLIESPESPYVYPNYDF